MNKFMIKSLDSYNEKSFEMVTGLKKRKMIKLPMNIKAN